MLNLLFIAWVCFSSMFTVSQLALHFLFPVEY